MPEGVHLLQLKCRSSRTKQTQDFGRSYLSVLYPEGGSSSVGASGLWDTDVLARLRIPISSGVAVTVRSGVSLRVGMFGCKPKSLL